MKKILHLFPITRGDSSSSTNTWRLPGPLSYRSLLIVLRTPAFLIIRYRQASVQATLIHHRPCRAKSKFNDESTEETSESNRTTNIDGDQDSPLTSRLEIATHHVTPSAYVAHHVERRRETIPSFPFTNRSLGTHPVTRDRRCNSR